MIKIGLTHQGCSNERLFREERLEPVHVKRPAMPPLEEFISCLEAIWDSRVLTNCGPFHEQFERELAEFLGVEHLALFCNGTIGLVTALQALRVAGEVITTPYSFVATTHALLWNGLTPVFVDIDPVTFSIDPKKIEEAITPRTTSILPVHTYGIPCDFEAIQRIADIYGLKVIYDAAHAFGVRDSGGSILRHGDLSVLSFHATKVFHTFEGGAIICPDAKTKQRIDYLKNFGFADEVTVVAPGINGKMNEFQAAYGVVALKHYGTWHASCSAVSHRYRELLTGVSGIRLLNVPEKLEWNYAYFPILVEDGYPLTRDDLYYKLRREGIHARRYFYPLISEFPMYRGFESAKLEHLPRAYEVSRKVLCLPMFAELPIDVVESICRLIAEG
ncbi:DegT/DnrJ/EryC1/StrS family aminotransferase [Methylohalobius crimeensis]|uniref:DegT/DnrJ/EryC1/StrS family aminotransferase n=1 Tax=Methylohalobius crimeensis TaxID=244365 RepID=UPI0003B5A73E|nr:DegT/DnrJ/EryC1/StrS family aminotransferase [Methylohalobius crimeensis]